MAVWWVKPLITTSLRRTGHIFTRETDGVIEGRGGVRWTWTQSVQGVIATWSVISTRIS